MGDQHHANEKASKDLQGSDKGSIKVSDGTSSERKDSSLLGWGWNDVNSAIADISGGLNPKSEDGKAPGAVKLAKWISNRIPIPTFSSEKKTVPGEAKKPLPTVAANKGTHAPLIFTSSKSVKDGQYSLEHLYLALSKKLYDEGF